MISFFDFGKQITFDSYGNILMAIFNRSFVLKNNFGAQALNDIPQDYDLYKSLKSIDFRRIGIKQKSVLPLRNKKCNFMLSHPDKLGFWACYSDGLILHLYNGREYKIRINGREIVGTYLLLH